MDDNVKFNFLNILFAGIPKQKQCVYSNIKFFGRIDYLEDQNDKLVSPIDIKDDSGLSLYEFVLGVIPTVEIAKANVKDIDIKLFNEMTKQMEYLSKQMQDKINQDKQWKEEKRQFEEQRIKENEELRRELEDERREKEKVAREKEQVSTEKVV
jgi:ABC-type Na+ transport system ATPase subunit NatA